MKTKPITATMAECLGYTHEYGGTLHRYEGGRWARPGWAWSGKHFNASTVQGLLDRGELEITEWKQGKHVRFPVAVSIKKEATND